MVSERCGLYKSKNYIVRLKFKNITNDIKIVYNYKKFKEKIQNKNSSEMSKWKGESGRSLRQYHPPAPNTWTSKTS